MRNRRYLTTFSSKEVLHRFSDFIVIGAGVAGLRTAIQIAENTDFSVIVLSKGKPNECNSDKAQGGIATVLEPQKTGDSKESHVEDTIACSAGLAEEDIVRITVEEGAERIRELISWGANFDKHNGNIDYTKEGGHRKPRILHANGDATGHEILRVLLSKAKLSPQIQIIEGAFALDLLVSEGHCSGVLAYEECAKKVALWSRCVIIASGGYGRLFRETTNGPLTTGDGIAMAYRAGAEIQNLEFIQFHPTTLYIAGAERYLITESARGEGGILKNYNGERFMKEYHEMAELAPRDVVARAILDQISKTNHPMVYLDLTALGKEKIKKRFPGIVSICSQFDIDPTIEGIPVRPSAHYTIGGIRTDSMGRTSIPGLFACGEAACTGLHGANRLGSNSLLEGLVFGFRCGLSASEDAGKYPIPSCPNNLKMETHYKRIQFDADDMRSSLTNLMVRNVGILRNQKELSKAHKLLTRWAENIGEGEFFDRSDWELQNMVLVCLLITESALWRCESRGAHFREDYPLTEKTFDKKLIIIKGKKWREIQ